ncbi:hypothetical protein E0M76_24835, partial [Escherichia coli]|nr:hypothetical protein [Escherichia coli]
MISLSPPTICNSALVDWSDIREQKRLMVLRASVALHGRSVTLYEKAFPLSEQCSKKAHDQFLA